MVATGRVTVCVVVPVKNCALALATVSVVVSAAVTVVAYPQTQLLKDILALESLVTIVDAVAALVIAVPVGKAFNTGAVEKVFAPVIVSVLSRYIASQSLIAVLSCAFVKLHRTAALPTEVTWPVRFAFVVTVVASPGVISAVPSNDVQPIKRAVVNLGAETIVITGVVVPVATVASELAELTLVTVPHPLPAFVIEYAESHDAAVVPLASTQVTNVWEDAAIVCTRFPPEEFTVTTQLDLFIIMKECPTVRVAATGSTTVCVVEPVNCCPYVDETVRVVVPAAVTVVVSDSTTLLNNEFPSVVRDTRVDAVATDATAVPVGRALITGAVEKVFTPVMVSALSRYTTSQSDTAVFSCDFVNEPRLVALPIDVTAPVRFAFVASFPLSFWIA